MAGGGIGIGDGTGDISGGGHPAGGYGTATYGDSFGFAGPGWGGSGSASFGNDPGTGVGAYPTPANMQGSYGGLGSAYPGSGSGSGTGGASNNFYYPTPAEVYNSAYTLPHVQAQTGLLGNMSNMNAFRSAVLPEVQGVMKTLGRSGLPSSSYADRTITETMGSLYNKWLWNVLTGYQNLGVQMPQMMNQWYQPYNTMLGYVSA